MSDGTAVDIYEPVIADLRSRIAALQATIDNLESLRNGTPLQAAGNTGGLRVSGTAVNFGHDAFFNLTAADATKKYLGAIKKTASINTLSDALVTGGWKTSAKNIPENLRAILSRHPDFVRINSEFGLAEWYPGRKSAGKSKRVLGPDNEDWNQLKEEDATEASEIPSELARPSEQ